MALTTVFAKGVTSNATENDKASSLPVGVWQAEKDEEDICDNSIPTANTTGKSSQTSLPLGAQLDPPLLDLESGNNNNNSATEVVVVPGAPSDGGLQAWLQVLIAHLVIFSMWGYINSFGVFQTYYINVLDQSPSDISWIGSVQVFLLFFIGTFSGRATDADYFRHVFAVGTFLILLGVFMTSICTTYWQLFLAQGICTSIGNGLLFCPTLAILPIYFSKNRVGLAASGTTTGGMIIPGLFEGLLPRIGFGWTLFVLGLIMLVFQVLCLILSRTRVPPRSFGPLVEFSAFREVPYLLFAIGLFLCF